MQNSNILMYTTEDGITKVEVTFENDTVWLSLDQMAELFQRDKSTISRHIKNIFAEGELNKNSVVANFATTASDGKVYQVDYYNLDVIISVGYRVKSLRGTQFRIWATNVLKEYMRKGFALDDERLKRLGGGNYFDELLSRIRDIRSSEKVFWRKVLEIYATSIDYNPKAESSVLFFKQVQNKMHWAAHKHTAAEIIFERANADSENMGLTSWDGKQIKRTDVEIAKNYLNSEEIDALNKIVTAYLDIAEVRALAQEPMYMKDWLETIDDYLKMTRRDILVTKGKVTHKQAIEKAHKEYDKYVLKYEEQISPVEKHFIESINELEGLLELAILFLTLITRDFITSMHRIMPIILKKHGFNIDEYEETKEKKQGGLSAKEYKKKMEQEKEELNKKLEDMVKEYNELVDRYNKLIDDKAELERKNKEKAYEVMYQQEHSR